MRRICCLVNLEMVLTVSINDSYCIKWLCQMSSRDPITLVVKKSRYWMLLLNWKAGMNWWQLLSLFKTSCDKSHEEERTQSEWASQHPLDGPMDISTTLIWVWWSWWVIVQGCQWLCETRRVGDTAKIGMAKEAPPKARQGWNGWPLQQPRPCNLSRLPSR